MAGMRIAERRSLGGVVSVGGTGFVSKKVDLKNTLAIVCSVAIVLLAIWAAFGTSFGPTVDPAPVVVPAPETGTE